MCLFFNSNYTGAIQGCSVVKSKLAVKELLPLKITFFPYFLCLFICYFLYNKCDLENTCKMDEILLLSTTITFELFSVVWLSKKLAVQDLLDLKITIFIISYYEFSFENLI